MSDPVVPSAIETGQATPLQPAFVPAPTSLAPPAGWVAPKRRNHVGIGAFILGVSAFLSPAIGVVAGFALIGELPNTEGLNFFNVLFFGTIGAGVGAAIGVVAMVLGFVSFAIRNAKRLWGILGLVLGFAAIVIGWIPLFAFLSTLANPGAPGVPING
jgi:hypothetical protein